MKYIESGIQFDFSKACKVIEYEALLPAIPSVPPNQRNTFWPGIDFHIEDAPGEAIWLEVKSWNPARLSPKNRGGSQRSFVSKMQSKIFAQEMRGKFWGTTSFFAWDGRFLPSDARFILLLEPPRPLDAALVLTFGQKINQQVLPPKMLAWRSRIHVAALTLAEWNLRFPDLPATNLS